ncbi:MAG: hypothetical protein CL840_17910 [Crocinitomicaceae bacterium]|nr:hypothetical protein [Crocinitomicaceae bacterium]|tara:strand:+ start:4591 stop:6333 length:1743 start_codon:yes stop_codon:yes gene_type:complete
MVKLSCTVLLLLFFGSLWAQTSFQETRIEPLVETSFYPEAAVIKDKKEARQYALEWLNSRNDFTENKGSIQLISERSTNHSVHYRFELMVNNKPIYGAQIKVSTSLEGNLISVMASNHKYKNISDLDGEYDLYYLSNDNLIPVNAIETKTNNGLTNNIKLVSESSDTLVKDDLNYYKSDTTATVRVFYPEPITSAKTTYGIPYNDRGDSINPQLQAEHFTKTMPLIFRDDTFRLESDYFKMNEHSLPIEKIWTGTSDQINYNRSDTFFEQINVFYHLSRFRTHMDSLGYKSLGKHQINIDAHGFAGADASAYSANFSPPRLTFGQGGVDDAEDPGIIIHEYTHALTDHAAPNSNLGFQRNAIDEGISDYIAASYLREISEYRYDELFKWDGHNEFWLGRKINFNQKYPQDTTGTSHKAGGILNTILMKLNSEIGRDNADKLAFEIMYDFIPLLTYPDLADIIVNAEKQLFNEKYKKEVCDVLWNHGLKDACYIGIKENEVPKELLVFNSARFAQGTGSVEIVLPSSKQYPFQVLNSSGSVVGNGNSKNGIIAFTPGTFNSGIFFVRVLEGNYSVVRLVVL